MVVDLNKCRAIHGRWLQRGVLLSSTQKLLPPPPYSRLPRASTHFMYVIYYTLLALPTIKRRNIHLFLNSCTRDKRLTRLPWTQKSTTRFYFTLQEESGKVKHFFSFSNHALMSVILRCAGESSKNIAECCHYSSSLVVVCRHRWWCWWQGDRQCLLQTFIVLPLQRTQNDLYLNSHRAA